MARVQYKSYHVPVWGIYEPNTKYLQQNNATVVPVALIVNTQMYTYTWSAYLLSNPTWDIAVMRQAVHPLQRQICRKLARYLIKVREVKRAQLLHRNAISISLFVYD